MITLNWLAIRSGDGDESAVYYVRAGVRDSVVAAALGPLLRKPAQR
jgi:hypothetical protein